MAGALVLASDLEDIEPMCLHTLGDLGVSGLDLNEEDVLNIGFVLDEYIQIETEPTATSFARRSIA